MQLEVLPSCIDDPSNAALLDVPMIDPSDIPLKAVSAGITLEAVRVEIELIRSALEWSGISRPRIAVAALNPHAGEGAVRL